MKIKIHHLLKRLIVGGALGAAVAHADPLVTSWFTTNGGKYAQIYTSTANRTAGISTTTWTGQSSPTYAGVHEIDYSANWVYIKNTGLASFIMGPWSNPNLPSNQGANTPVYRFPRGVAGTTTTNATKTSTPMGAIGFLVDGISIYNTSDGYSYDHSASQDADPIAGLGNGDGVWHRDAWTNEFVSFDYGYNHPPPNGQYHSHGNPIATRYLLGDNVTYNSSTKVYTEVTTNTNLKHSPLIGWMADGLPLYGPFGYSNPTNPASGIRQMVSGYVLRDGTYGNTNLASTGRTTIPIWALATQSRTSVVLASSVYGPATTYTSSGSGGSLTYTLGHYAEDYDYLGDLGFAQGVTNTVNGYTAFYDLNKYNVRYCVTPEYPGGTWAYFVTLKTNGTPAFPYMCGPQFFGNPTGGSTTTSVMNADTPLTLYFKGGTNLPAVLNAPSVNSGSVTLLWSAVQGGTYQVQVSSNLVTWTTNTSLTLTATNNTATATETGLGSVTPRFYRVSRTAVATYDSTGY